MRVDLIVPCFNEEQVLPLFWEEAFRTVSEIPGYEFGFLFVDDGSKDRTLAILRELADEHPEVSYISFSRNFGKEAAMFAALSHTKADYAVILDADLQHPPALIAPMLGAMEEGYDCCTAIRSRKGDPKLRTWFSRKFYQLMNRISDVQLKDGAGDFRMMNRKMIDAVLSLQEVSRFSKGIFSYVGFRNKEISYENVERAAGTSKWSFVKLFRYALDGITAFSTFPLKFAAFMGGCFSFAAFVYLLVLVIKTCISGIDVPGYASTIALILLLGGVILLCLGIVGEYLAKIYTEIKRRPVYLIGESRLKEREPEESGPEED
ncbi:MAG: glycosyltransferase family 2 protein [Lachnospiraceae bacterium]|nr:glycosyltransferase family 2 protein [Lachnospiraceae bacterium]MBQ9563468.1 glycosyltransferase family 2 protein [Lachnospiraceae bacterium]